MKSKIPFDSDNVDRDLIYILCIFIFLTLVITITSVYSYIHKLQYERNTIKVEMQVLDAKYTTAIDNLNSINAYVDELETRLDKLEKLDKVYKEISRIYNK